MTAPQPVSMVFVYKPDSAYVNTLEKSEIFHAILKQLSRLSISHGYIDIATESI
jgi:hypothetical protein